MSNTHTPGQWSVWPALEENKPLLITSELDGEEIAIANVFNQPGEGDANARLIAAAPELLEVVRQLIPCVDNVRPLKVREDTIFKARSLLDKIDNKTPLAIPKAKR